MEHQVSLLRLESKAAIDRKIFKAGANGKDADGYIHSDFLLPHGIHNIDWIGGNKPYQTSDQAHFVQDLKRVIDEQKPDLIQAGPLHLSAYLVALTGFQPLVSMSWGYDLLYEAPRSEEVQQAIRTALQHSSAMVGDCNTIRQLAISYGMPDEKIVTFPWGIDLEQFSPAVELESADAKHMPMTENQPTVRPFVLLSTRNWEPIYGVEEIARAFVLAVQERPELRLIMLGSGSLAGRLHQILGVGADGYTRADHEKQPQPGVLDRVSFPGLVDQQALVDYYRTADLYLSASHSDGTSISLLEAMACARPVLVSDIPGNREWVEPGVNGWWFPEGDHQVLAQAIIHAYDSRERLQAMGQAGRRIAEQRADWRQNFSQLFNAYEIALKHR